MKKLITLLLATGAFVAVHAQTSKDEARRIILGQEKGGNNNTNSRNGRDVVLGGGNEKTYPNSYPNNYPAGSRQAEVDRVNREYDQKIWSIRNNNRLSSEEKTRIIRQLEQDRAKKIRQVNQSDRYGYGKKGKKYDDDDDYGKRYGKSNNGKHSGWEKGKGNPHKNGGKPGKERG
ncbi:MAG: DUF1542 domain-containing protein [Flavisolibacter sp.]|nr:DUF1542 domain-containing protein [Flavisolibacter sp.]